MKKNEKTSCDGECLVFKYDECIFVDSPDDEVIQFEYEKPNDIPTCLGYRTSSPDYGEEFDCEYDVSWVCEECLCNWDIGGYKDPRKPEKYEGDDMNIDPKIIEKAAIKAHEIYKYFIESVSDEKVPGWELAEDWQRESSIENVKAVINGSSSDPEEEHKRWYKEKIDSGWKYGPVKDGELKTHPCLVDFFELPIYKRALDPIINWTVRSVLQNEGVSIE